MRNRDYKNFFPGGYFHIYNRGNAKQEVFLDSHDYEFFLSRLNEYLYPERVGQQIGRLRYKRKSLPSNAFTLLSYCLMPNHFHFLIRQNSDTSLGKLFGKVCTSYSIYFNKKYEHVGHVFQDRFKSVWVDTDKYLLWLSAYIHQNPKTAGLVGDLKNWKYSSFLEYLGTGVERFCKIKFLQDMAGGSAKYKKFVEDSYELIQTNKNIKEYLLD